MKKMLKILKMLHMSTPPPPTLPRRQRGPQRKQEWKIWANNAYCDMHAECPGSCPVNWMRAIGKMAAYAVSITCRHDNKTIWSMVANVVLEGTFCDLFGKFNKHQQYRCVSVSVSETNNGPWRETGLTESISVLSFLNLRHIVYQADPAPEADGLAQREEKQVTNAFDMLMNAAKQRALPPKKDGDATSLNNKDRLYNEVRQIVSNF